MMMLSVEKKNRERHGREIKRSSKGNLLLIALQPRTFGCYQGGFHSQTSCYYEIGFDERNR